MIVDFADFREREDRSRYIAKRFRPYLCRKVLDVGCDRAVLKDLVTDIEYTGIDVGGRPDLLLDLETIDRLPFDDAAFDCVVCSDVLEHLDNLHTIFDEILRVTKRWAIISWPNNWVNARVPIARGYGVLKHYGLPPAKPHDRHKWFFNLTEAHEFVCRKLAESTDVILRDCRCTEKPRHLVRRWARRLLFPCRHHYLNRYAHTLWAVFSKQHREISPNPGDGQAAKPSAERP
jgi:SAM-dependent methyltransferase